MPTAGGTASCGGAEPSRRIADTRESPWRCARQDPPTRRPASSKTVVRDCISDEPHTGRRPRCRAVDRPSCERPSRGHVSIHTGGPAKSPGPRSARSPLTSALQRRRRQRQGLITLAYVFAAIALTVLLSYVKAGPRVHSSIVAPTLGAVAGGMLTFTGVVFSLLFLVIQFGATTFTPRLNLFRDDPFVWHAFGFFVGAITYCSVGALDLSNQTDVSALVPVFAVLAALTALALFRILQMRALGSIQLASAVESVVRRGEMVLQQYYKEPFVEAPFVEEREPVAQHPAGRTDVRWPETDRVVQQIDLPGLLTWGASRQAVVEIRVPIGSVIATQEVVASVYGPVSDPDGVLAFIYTGLERTFDQDPLFAFRLLSDITVRALSPAVNDPATAIQVIGATSGLLRRVVGARLDLPAARAADGSPRLKLTLPRWQDFLSEAVDETALAARAQPTVLRRLWLMLDDLHGKAPVSRQASIQIRRDWVAAHLESAGPLPGESPGGGL